MFISLEKLSTGEFVAPVQSISRQFADSFNVTVALAGEKELALKNTLSALVGFEAPGAPPLEADQ